PAGRRTRTAPAGKGASSRSLHHPRPGGCEDFRDWWVLLTHPESRTLPTKGPSRPPPIFVAVAGTETDDPSVCPVGSSAFVTASWQLRRSAFEEAAQRRQPDQLAGRVHVKLAVDMRAVGLDRLHADEQGA